MNDLAVTLSVFLIALIPAAIFFSAIFLILRYIFKVKNRVLNAIIPLVIYFMIIYFVTWLFATGPGPDISFWPWTNCDHDVRCSYLDDLENNEDIPAIKARLACLICKTSVLSGQILIAIAASVIVIPPAIQKIKKVMKKS